MRLDNQRALARSFGVTLMTLRQALELLERENLIARRHGLGTFVAAPSIDYDILQLRRFAGDLSAQGEHVTTRMIGTRIAAADRHVTDALGLRARGRAVVLERLRLVDGHPMSLQRSFLPPAVGELVLRTFRLKGRRLPLRLDWFAAKGLAPIEAVTIDSRVTGEGPASDHEPIWVRVGPAS